MILSRRDPGDLRRRDDSSGGRSHFPFAGSRLAKGHAETRMAGRNCDAAVIDTSGWRAFRQEEHSIDGPAAPKIRELHSGEVLHERVRSVIKNHGDSWTAAI